ncbi:MAG TPA: hypothetical protein VHW43_13465, partial [Puia sp.]|nr:hypothetical protein [Puia sp.]
LPATHQNPTPEDDHDYAFDLVNALHAPIITYSEAWADLIPERLVAILPMARLTGILQHEPLATLAECVLYIYTRTLVGPMETHWVNIYGYTFCQTLSDWFGEDHWDLFHPSRKLTDWEQSQFLELRRRIY